MEQPFQFDLNTQSNWLHCGQTFTEETHQEANTYKKTAASFFSDSSSDSDMEENTVHIKDRKTAEKKSKIAKFQIKNPFEIEDSRKGKKMNMENPEYSGEMIIDKCKSLKTQRKKRKFLNKFALKKIKFNDIDITATIDPLSCQTNYKYGALQMNKVPLFTRIYTNRITGIRNIKISKQIMHELNVMTGQCSNEDIEKKTNRYFNQEVKGKGIPIFQKKKFNPGNDCIRVERGSEIEYENNIHENDPPLPDDEIENDSTRDYYLTKSLKIDLNLMSSNEKQLLEQNKILHSQIQEQPNNPDVWLRYMHFQESCINNSKAKYEKCLDILEKALTYPDNQTNFQLNLLNLRYYERKSPEDFDTLNLLWRKTLKNFSINQEFINEYLTFLKLNKKPHFTLTDLRDNYLSLLKFYEGVLANTTTNEDKVAFTNVVINIIFDYAILEHNSGFYEKAWDLLTSLFEKSVIKINNIPCSNEDYACYFESSYPKLGVFEVDCGYLDYAMKTHIVDKQLFSRQDFIENYIHVYETNTTPSDLETAFIINEQSCENYRSLNIVHDKDKLISRADSFIFYSDVKDFLEIQIAHNTQTLVSMLNKFWAFLGLKADPNEEICLSCKENSLIRLDWENSLIRTSSHLECKILFDRKFLNFGTGKRYHPQTYEYLLRFCRYLKKLNLLVNESSIFQLNLVFSHISGNDDLSSKLSFAKNLFKEKDNQNNLQLWLHYYKWCLYYNQFKDADKIIKLINTKIDIGEMLNEDTYMIKYITINHYIYYLFLLKKHLLTQLEANEQIIMDTLEGYIDNIILKLFNCYSPKNTVEDVIQQLEELIISKINYSRHFYILIISVLLYLNFKKNVISNQTSFKNRLERLMTLKTIAELHVKSKYLCPHFISQEFSLQFLGILYLLKESNSITLNSPIFIAEILEKMNKANLNRNDGMIILLLLQYCSFNNIIDCDMRFHSHFNNSLSLKHCYYYNFLRHEMNTHVLAVVRSYQDSWTTYHKNLLCASNEAIILREHPEVVTEYWGSLCRKLVKLHEKKLLMEYSLIMFHEYPFHKQSLLNIIRDIATFSVDLDDSDTAFCKEIINYLKSKELLIINEL